jgi:hypothetical protein
MCLFAKRLERGRFVWPSTSPREGADRTVTITPAQLGYLLEASTGGCRNTRGGRKQQADCGIVNHCAIAGSQHARLVIPCSGDEHE